MWELDYKESWVLKNGCFGTVVLEKTLESPLDCKEIQPVHPKGDHKYSLRGLMRKLKLKLQYFGHLMLRTDSFEKTLMLGKIEGRRRKGWQRMRWLDGITNSRSLLKLMSIESVMPSNHLILVIPFSSCPQFFPASESFPMSSSYQVDKALELELHHQSFQWIFRVYFL